MATKEKRFDSIKVDVNNLSDWRSEKTVQYASYIGGGNHLQLLATLYGGFKIVLNGVVKHEQIQPYNAAENFNNILEEII